MRFYDLDGGTILIDGIDYKDFDKRELRKAFGMVLQDTWLFTGSIKDNILYSKMDATEEEFQSALKAGHVDEFVKSLPNGVNLEVNEDSTNISQGQRQLLTISRAVLANPKLLILDEATSSVDTRTEIIIQKAMEELMANKTTFIIAHRLSTIRNSDLILVINHGDIIEQGSHDALIAKDGFYKQLYYSQFESE
jgi:ATP-binding cassette subfamily B protein